MYAPKYRSWITDEERRESALNYKASVHIAAIREMADKAMAEFAEPVPAAVAHQQDIQRMYMAYLDRNPYALQQQNSAYGGLQEALFRSRLF